MARKKRNWDFINKAKKYFAEKFDKAWTPTDPAINPLRRAKRAKMAELGIKTGKAFRKWERRQRREKRLQAVHHG